MGKIVILSGAGLSAPSGVSTFRDKDGLWLGHRIEDVCDFTTWKKNRSIVHGFYNRLRSSLESVEPNVGHRMIASWKSKYGDDAIVLTQNVDDLLERAGCHGIIHLHGYLQNMHCIACGNVWNVGYSHWNEDERCPKCTSIKGVKPGVVFFNQPAPNYAYLYQAFKKLTAADTVVVIGTSGQVINVEALLFDSKAFSILNNLEESPSIDSRMFNSTFYMSVEEAAPLIDELIKERHG